MELAKSQNNFNNLKEKYSFIVKQEAEARRKLVLALSDLQGLKERFSALECRQEELLKDNNTMDIRNKTLIKKMVNIEKEIEQKKMETKRQEVFLELTQKQLVKREKDINDRENILQDK